MTPTSKLRFVERYIQIDDTLTKVRILQNWWVFVTGEWVSPTQFDWRGEWRDVPLETEE